MLHGITEALRQQPAFAPVLTTVLAVLVGLFAQVWAQKLKLPSIIFLLAGGIALGPSGLGVVLPQFYGNGLRPLIALCVAIIVFEGALLIDLGHLTRASRAVLGLISVGLAVTWLAAAVLAHALLAIAWPVALLFGALVAVTGPTVIGPILNRISLAPNLRATLEGESVFADAIGVILASTIFSFILSPYSTLSAGLFHLVLAASSAAAIGVALSFASFWVLRALAPLPGTLVRLWVLTTALTVYVTAEGLAHESGILAVAVSGVLLGTLPLPYPETIKQFKGDLSVLALSLVFVLLAANLPLSRVIALGWPAVVLVFALLLVVRPIAVWLGTLTSDLGWREKAFVAALAPRGIVAASAATFFSLELQARGVPGGEPLAALVFLVVIGSVVLEGAAAPYVARALGVVPPKIVILGGDKRARRLAESLLARGEMIQLLDDNLDNVHSLLARELPAELCAIEDCDAIAKHRAHEAKTLVVATDDDTRNATIARTLKRRFPELRLFVRLNDEADRDALTALGVSIWPATDDKPGPLPLSIWNAAVAPDAALDVVVANLAVCHKPLSEVTLPAGVVIAVLRRSGRMRVPDGQTALLLGDTLTLLGEESALEQARRLFSAHARRPERHAFRFSTRPSGTR